MTVEEIRRHLRDESDKFHVRMRVLAVDDDPTCLMLLDGLLRKCQCHVTTTNQAKTTLKMLRENKNEFDLVISDVHMSDMNGFKLLELVGLEMGLPVIMLSVNGDPKLVMEGITHDACDYLVKPIRMEELRNILRKKFESKNQNKSSTQDKAHQGNGEGGQGGPTTTGDDTSSQNKPQVVWSIELQGKFAAAVNQLGIESAVPKRILDLMNVEGITRENVASHLQEHNFPVSFSFSVPLIDHKYRLYLKRISSVATQQANIVAALGEKDSSYMRMSLLDGLGDYRTLSGSGRLLNPALSSYQTGGMLGRLNSPSGMSLRSLSPSSLIQVSHTQNLGNSIANLGKLQPVVSAAYQNFSLFQGILTPLELDQLQQSKCTSSHITEFDFGDDATFFTSAGTLSDNRVSVGSSRNSLPSASSNPLILHGNPQQTQGGGVFSNQSALKVNSLNSERFNAGLGGSNFLGGFVDNGYDSLEDLMNGTGLMDGEFGFDAYSFGSCL
ncbi:hypothetical protein ACSBR1_022303 [Camellia fascicularis]